jgi:hypothetical protein
MADIVKLIDRIYQGFVLRDLLGFVAPGSISLISIWFIFNLDQNPQIVSQLCYLWRWLEGWKFITFFVLAYLLAWTLQSIHYDFLRIVGWILSRDTVVARLQKVHSRFIRAIFLPDRLFRKRFLNFTDCESRVNIDNVLRNSNIVTRGALELDFIISKSMDQESLKKRLDDFPYSERLSALMLLTSNLAIAAVLLVLMLTQRLQRLEIWLFLLVPIFLYFEFWRLWQARNLQVAIYAAALKQATNPNAFE